jgi:hypothetical protein
MDDTQFLTGPGVADVDGDGVAEVLAGSGAYLVRAYRADGGVPAGFPKLTHGWIISPPTAGDVDGDGLIELVVGTREGDLFVWDTPAPATETAIPWQGFGRDRRNTGNLASGVSPLAPPPLAGDPLEELAEALEALRAELEAGPCGLFCRLVVHDLGRAIRDLEREKVAPAAARFWRIHLLLSWVDRDLATRFADAVAEAVDALLEDARCAPGDRRCHNALWRARIFDWVGDHYAATGSSPVAVHWWAKALAAAARL